MYNFLPDDDLYRGIHPTWWSVTDKRPTSAAFKDPELSVDWCKYSSLQESFERYKRLFGLDTAAIVSFKVQNAENLGQEVKHDPDEINGEYNEAHTLVSGKKTKKIARQFAREYAQVYPEFQL